VIAISSLAEAYRRWAEYARSEERNPLLQYQRARKSLEIALAALESGVSDDRIRATATDAAIEAVRGIEQCLRMSTPISGLSDWFDSLSRVLVRFASAEYWGTLCNELQRVAQMTDCPPSGKRAAQQARLIDTQGTAAASGTGDAKSAGILIGEIASLREGYGFVRHPAFPDNVFFHRADLLDPESFAALNTGALVQFAVVQSPRGDRAVGVTRIQI
jgi:cold shock CspA family protein